jgi:hypothetical protein
VLGYEILPNKYFYRYQPPTPAKNCWPNSGDWRRKPRNCWRGWTGFSPQNVWRMLQLYRT